MAKFTISGLTKPGDSFLFESDNLDEVLNAVDTMRNSAPPLDADPVYVAQQAAQPFPTQEVHQAQQATVEPPKRTRTRKAAEAPAPVQPEATQEQPHSPSPFANANVPFAPAPDHSSNGATERAAVVKLKTHLAALAAAHGEGQVYSWAIQNAFNLPVETTKDVFLNEKIYGFTDDRLEAAYRMSGGQ
jgi:cell wall-associated NlpC family hydrolase